MKVRVNILNKGVSIPQEVLDACGGDELVARIFYNWGYKNPDTIRQMLNPELYVPTTPDEFSDMPRVADRTLCAAYHQEQI